MSFRTFVTRPNIRQTQYESRQVTTMKTNCSQLEMFIENVLKLGEMFLQNFGVYFSQNRLINRIYHVEN